MTYWTIKAPDGWLFMDCLRSTRAEAIHYLTSLHGVTWEKIRRAGYRCVRVTIQEVER